MNWSQFFKSAVGRKITMSLTGIFLILFLLLHAGLNACIWANDGGAMFNAGAHFMGSTIIPRVLEVGLFVFFIIHVVQGIKLTIQNRSKRSVGYAVPMGNNGSKWYSRSMGLLGSLILIFIAVHLAHFWFPNRSNQGFLLGEEINLYEKMKEVFSHIAPVIIYELGVIALFWHLLHGFQSAFRTLGLSNHRYIGLIKGLGFWYSLIICLAFFFMPLSFHFGWIQ
ncbi:MAG TPA: succinate dehydrogenase cytochrome b subunit [Niabella sp.]|nr:succinate dehydrogenase cytochrome b subunit [Niabella sp.]